MLKVNGSVQKLTVNSILSDLQETLTKNFLDTVVGQFKIIIQGILFDWLIVHTVSGDVKISNSPVQEFHKVLSLEK